MVRSAQGHALINGDIVADLRRFPYDGKAMINQKVTTDLRPRVNVDGSQKTGEMIDQAGQIRKVRAEQPGSNAQQVKSKHAGVQPNLNRTHTSKGRSMSSGGITEVVKLNKK